MTEIQKEILLTIYHYRTVSHKQIIQRLGGTEEEVELLINQRLIDPQTHETLVYYFLTTKGVNQVKDWLRLKQRKHKDNNGYLTASQLAFHPRVVHHQLAVVEFALRLKELDEWSSGTSWMFKDGARLTQEIFKYARPDGWFQLGDLEVFLEIDRGTERKVEIKKKMERYLRFKGSDCYGKRRILVLFCYLNQATPQRKQMIIDQATDVFSTRLDDKLDFVLGDMERCLTFLKEEVITMTSAPYLPASQLNILKNYHAYLQLTQPTNQLNLDYVNKVPIDRSCRVYYWVDVRSERFSRLATLDLLNVQMKGALYQSQMNFLIYVKDDQQAQQLKARYSIVANHPHVQFITNHQVETLFKHLPTN